jgi:predicted RNase H-like nuclease (RuvC/YqgF family)
MIKAMADAEGPIPGQRKELLVTAYEQRTNQLREARGALAEAVSALTAELDRRRAETAALQDERDRAQLEQRAERERAEALAGELEARSLREAELEAELRESRKQVAVLANMKVVRFTVWPRRIVYRLRARRG